MTIRIYEPNEGLPERHFETTVHDEEIIDQIVSNLEEIKLKRGIHPNGHISDYSLDFVTKREIKDRIYEYFNIYVYWNQDSLNMNRIVGDRQSVETIEALIQNIDANWKEVVYHEFE